MKPSRALIVAVQSKVGVTPDADPQAATFRAIYKSLTGLDWIEPTASAPTVTVAGFPAEAVALILEDEGLDQPGEWPGGGSGITLGFGCDIGADPDSLEFWRGILTNHQIDRLATAKGITGRAAAQIQTRYSDIRVTREQAMQVFIERSLPREIALTRATYPGIELFPASVLGAMTSITYNRGADLDRDLSEGDRREELRNIYAIITGEASKPEPDRDIRMASSKIALEIASMKRLWAGKGLNGLLTRRDAEASLITSSLT